MLAYRFELAKATLRNSFCLRHASLPQPLRAMLGNSSILKDVCVGGSDGARHGGICAGVNGSEDCNVYVSEAAFATITLGDVSGVTTHVGIQPRFAAGFAFWA